MNLEIRKRNADGKKTGKYQKPPYCGALKEAGREKDLRLAGEDRSSKGRAGAGMNCGYWR
jgi:hypothetical protein